MQIASAPASATRRAISVALTVVWSHPERIFTVTGAGAWATSVSTSLDRTSGSLSRAAPSPLRVTFLTGQAALRSTSAYGIAVKDFEGTREVLGLAGEQLDAQGRIVRAMIAKD